MMRFLLPTLLLAGGVGCAAAVRDAGGYRLSVATHEADALEDAEALLSAARAATSSTTCQRYAAIGLTRRARAAWRAKMELFVAGLSDEDPGPKPPIPPVETICGGAR